MNFNPHYDLIGKHAFLSASKWNWLNYDEDHLRTAYDRSLAKEHGTAMHDLAKRCIDLKVKLPQSRKTLNSYVNDAIKYRMRTEQILYFSRNCFGTADAISFKKNFLRIHDLKTGQIPAHMEQLLIYEALFCLEYGVKPSKISSELRIYQSDEVLVYTPEADEIDSVMGKIVEFDTLVNRFRVEEEW